VLLHGWGGLCAHDRAKRDLHDVIIISAGPGLELALGISCAIAWAIVSATSPETAANPVVNTAFQYFVFINVVWALINLVPLWPLDGGQLFRLFLLRVLGPRTGEKVTHWVGMGVGVMAALAFFKLGSIFATLVFAWLAWNNFQASRGGGGGGPVRRKNKFADELFTRATTAMAQGNYAEASRLGHQIRSETNLPDSLMAKVWALLTVATTRMGEFEQALSYAQRSPETSAVIRATIESLAGTGQIHAAREKLTRDATKLAPSDRAEMETLLSGA
jgi:hypothetical protein